MIEYREEIKIFGQQPPRRTYAYVLLFLLLRWRRKLSNIVCACVVQAVSYREKLQANHTHTDPPSCICLIIYLHDAPDEHTCTYVQRVVSVRQFIGEENLRQMKGGQQQQKCC